jgi:hypothetical protein
MLACFDSLAQVPDKQIRKLSENHRDAQTAYEFIGSKRYEYEGVERIKTRDDSDNLVYGVRLTGRSKFETMSVSIMESGEVSVTTTNFGKSSTQKFKSHIVTEMLRSLGYYFNE